MYKNKHTSYMNMVTMAKLLLIVIANMAISACSSDESDDITSSYELDETVNSENTVVSVTFEKHEINPEPCLPGQVSFNSGYGNYKDQQCSQLAILVEEKFTTRLRYRRPCKNKTGAINVPDSVARVQLNTCAPMLKGDNGVSASVHVCCNIPEPEADPVIVSYDTKLNCPSDHLMTLATNLHDPNKACAEAVVQAESQLNSSHYTRACTSASVRYTRERQSVLNAVVFTCREDAGVLGDN